MAGLSCPGLGSDLRDGVAWQCELYAEAWKSLATEGVHSVYGAHEPSAAEKDDLLASGTCIFDVTFAAVHGSATKILGRFPTPGCGVGGKFFHRTRGEQAAVAVISATHPDVDFVAQASFVSLDTDTDRRQGSLVLDLREADASAVLEVHGALRVDMEARWVSLHRQTQALDMFCAKGVPCSDPTRLQYLVCGKVGTTLERRYINDHRAGVSRHLQTILGYRNHGL